MIWGISYFVISILSTAVIFYVEHIKKQVPFRVKDIMGTLLFISIMPFSLVMAIESINSEFDFGNIVLYNHKNRDV